MVWGDLLDREVVRGAMAPLQLAYLPDSDNEKTVPSPLLPP